MSNRILLALFLIMDALNLTAQNPATIEVTGSATINIVPDKITVEIGMEEFYRKDSASDSVKMDLEKIEQQIRAVFTNAGVTSNNITTTEIGNYKDKSSSERFLMAKKLSAVLTDFNQLEIIASTLPDRGVTSFFITRLDNSDMSAYNRQGLKSALDAARAKAEFIAANENVTLVSPLEIIETGPNYYETPSFSNVAFDSGAGMDNMRRITRRYSVKVRYIFTAK